MGGGNQHSAIWDASVKPNHPCYTVCHELHPRCSVLLAAVFLGRVGGRELVVKHELAGVEQSPEYIFQHAVYVLFFGQDRREFTQFAFSRFAS